MLVVHIFGVACVLILTPHPLVVIGFDSEQIIQILLGSRAQHLTILMLKDLIYQNIKLN